MARRSKGSAAEDRTSPLPKSTLLRLITHTAVFSFGFALASGAAAEAAPLATDRDMVTGVSVTEADCRAQSGRLWVRAETRGFCVRFWLSTAGGSKDEALVAFHGDIGGRIDGKLQLVEGAWSISDESLQKAAGYGSRLYRGPYIWIARPGAFGSSGHHLKDRRTLLEIRVAMAALDVLKQHYGFKLFHLVGQSGGGHTVAGLAQLRSDIGCAVIASAAVSLRSSLRDSGHPIVGKHRYYDPIDHVNTMRQRPGLRLFVVSDRNDKFVSYLSQLEFVERVKAHNLPITHVTATAIDENSHDLFDQGLRLAADCANPEREAERAWAATKDTTTIAVLEELVRRYGDSHYAALARARMEELRKSQTQQPQTQTDELGAWKAELAKLAWKAELAKLLEINRRYPPKARSAKEEGTVLVAFTLDRQGRVVANRIVQSSGFVTLDNEVLELVSRAQPFPAPPPVGIAHGVTVTAIRTVRTTGLPPVLSPRRA
jgi:TonB family protein